MWIAVRLLAALLGFFARYAHRLFSPSPVGELQGHPYFKKVSKDKGDKVTGFRVGIAMRVPVVFRLQREANSDRWFKRMGLATEFQTGDAAFDRAVYIACDHPAFHQLLKEKPAAREKIRALLSAGFTRISADGEVLWIERSARRQPREQELQQLAELRTALGDFGSKLRFFSDPFHARVVAVEALTWSVFAYALGGYIELLFDGQDAHLHHTELVMMGVVASVVLFALLFGFVAWLLKGSSRGHRVLVEGAVLLALSGPVAGIQAVADVNRALDTSATSVVTCPITYKHSERRRKQATRYFLSLGAPTEGTAIDLPDRVSVSYDTYAQAQVGGAVQLHIAQGALGLPWYRRIVVR